MENERFVDVEGKKVPVSEFMKEEVWRKAEGISNDWSIFEVSNYGNVLYHNKKTGKSGPIATGKVTVISGGESVRVLIPVIMLNVFMGDTFKSGDSLCYIDGNRKNFRLDNVFKIPAGSKHEKGARVFLRNSYPNPKVMRRASSANLKVKHPSAGVMITNRSLLQMLKKSLVFVFCKSTIPVPASILYGCLVDSFGDDVKNIMSLNDFIVELPSNLRSGDTHKSFFLCAGQAGIKPLPNDGFVSLRIAKEMKDVFGDVSCRYRYVVDRKNPYVVSFTDMETPDGNTFDVYPAPDYFTAMRYIGTLTGKEVDGRFDMENIENWMYGLLSEEHKEGGDDE